MPAVKFQYPAGCIIEKVAIVGDGYHGSGIFNQEAFQPGNTFRIEVVGRFIQQQHIRVGQQQFAQGHPSTFSSGKFCNIGVPGGQAQGVGSNFQFAVQFPAAHGIDGILQFALFIQQGGHFIVFHGFGELFADCVEPVKQGFCLTQAFFNIAAYILAGVQLRFLGKEANLDAGLWPCFSLIFLVFACHDA